jgi:hypothetical protein
MVITSPICRRLYLVNYSNLQNKINNIKPINHNMMRDEDRGLCIFIIKDMHCHLINILAMGETPSILNLYTFERPYIYNILFVQCTLYVTKYDTPLNQD